MRTKLGAMREQQASRTLLKSPPELWAECSDAQSLAKHLGEFGEIRINKLEPEHTVAWEGDRASGTVKLEPSGWGTRVTLTYSTLHSEQVPPQPVLEPEPEPQVERSPDGEPEPVSSEPKADAAPTSEQPPAGQNRGRLFKRVLRFLAPERGTTEPVAPVAAPEQSAAQPAAPERQAPEPPPPAPPPSESAGPQPTAPPMVAREPARPTETSEALAAALDSLGQAHHRPFSRA